MYVVFVAIVVSIAYMFIAYLRTAGLFYNPPWIDPLFYVSALVGLIAVGMGATRSVPMHGGWRVSLIVGGLLVIAECGGAYWFDRTFQAQCDSLPLNSFAAGCPDLPYK